MLHRMFASGLTILLLAASAVAADKQVIGTVESVNRTKKSIVVKTDDGVKTYQITDDTEIVGARGGQTDLKDERLAKGTEVSITVAGNNRTAKKIKIGRAAKSKVGASREATTDEKPTAKRKLTDRPDSRTSKESKPADDAPSKESTKPTRSTSKKVITKEAEPADEPPSKETTKPTRSISKKVSTQDSPERTKTIAGGIKGTVLGVDLDDSRLTVQTEEGKKMDLTITRSTEIVGPRGGVSKLGLRDDRLHEGAKVIFVVKNGQATEVHLPYRKTAK